MIRIIVTVLLALASPLIAAEVGRTNSYDQQLEQQVFLQKQRAAYYLTQMQGNPNLSTKFREAEKVLQIKQFLYQHFANSPALQDPAVRAALLHLMEREVINPEDLKAFQKLLEQS